MTSEVARREQRSFWEPSKATKRAHGAKSRLLGGVPRFIGFPGCVCVSGLRLRVLGVLL